MIAFTFENGAYPDEMQHCALSLKFALFVKELAERFLLYIRPRGYKLFPCSNTTPKRLKVKNFFICHYFSFYEQLKFCAQLSFLTSGPDLTLAWPLDKEFVIKNKIIISRPKHMLWVLKRTVSMRRFF